MLGKITFNKYKIIYSYKKYLIWQNNYNSYKVKYSVKIFKNIKNTTETIT